MCHEQGVFYDIDQIPKESDMASKCGYSSVLRAFLAIEGMKILEYIFGFINTTKC